MCRLETDRHQIATRVTALLVNSYFPETKPEAEQVKRYTMDYVVSEC